MKVCVTCHELKPLESFALRSASKDGRQGRCRDCFRGWYAANTSVAREAIDRRRAGRRAEVRAKLADYLMDHPCVDCGETDLRVLELDHRVGSGKRFGIGQMLTGGWNWSAVAHEIGKCDVRCANCHRRVTAERADQWRHRWWLEQTFPSSEERLLALFGHG